MATRPAHQGFNPYLTATDRAAENPPVTRYYEEVFSLPFVEVPARGSASTQAPVQTFFRAKRFCLYADDASKLRVHLHFGCEVGGTSSTVEMPAALFSDGPVVDRTPFVLHCSECGAPTKEAAPKCAYCSAPFTWRLTETAFGQSGLALTFPTISPGVSLVAQFSNRSDHPIGVDAAFIGVSAHQTYKEYG